MSALRFYQACAPTRLRTLHFVGNRGNLCSFFAPREFQGHLHRLGGGVPEAAGWHDFSGAEALRGVRNSGVDEHHLNRLALKLHSSQCASVPAVPGYEPAWRTAGQMKVDCLEGARQFSDDAVRVERRALRAQDLLPRFAAWRLRLWPRLRTGRCGAVSARLPWCRSGGFALRLPT